MIEIIGPREAQHYCGAHVVNTVSHGPGWQRELSPFVLGPLPLRSGQMARTMENAWQFSKVYPSHVDADGNPTEEYFRWARAGFESAHAVRYPMGKGAHPLYSLWGERRLSYVDARKEIYLPRYREAVRSTAAYARLKSM